MDKKNENLSNIGIIMVCLGGLFLILDLKPEGWEFEISILTAMIAVAGFVLILYANKKTKA